MLALVLIYAVMYAASWVVMPFYSVWTGGIPFPNWVSALVMALLLLNLRYNYFTTLEIYAIILLSYCLQLK